MAEITSNAGDSRPGKGSRRAKRHSTKVDFTPMVDLGFLLITFFILTSQLQEPKAMNLLMPTDKSRDDQLIKMSTALTIVPMENDRIFFYHGKFEDAIQTNSFGVINAGNGLRNLIQIKQKELEKSAKFRATDVMLIIKPANNSKVKNVVDAFDEVQINDVRHYSFVNLDPAEESFLRKKKIMN